MVSVEESDEEGEVDFGGRLPADAELIAVHAATRRMSNLFEFESTSLPTDEPTDRMIFVPPILC
jgi:hypothetical protein